MMCFNFGMKTRSKRSNVLNIDKKQRNWRFDYLKGISCIIVVFLHCRFPGIIGDLIIYAFRFSVPIFFMITGFYSNFKDNKWMYNKALNLIKMIFLTELLYFILSLFNTCIIRKKTFIFFWNSISALEHPIRTVLCGSFFYGPLWYLYAAFWTYVILLIFGRKLKKHKILCWGIILVLIFFQILGRYYCQNVFDIDQYIFLFRNALSFGLPLTLLGMRFAENERKIEIRVIFPKSINIICAGLLLIVIEYFISGQYMDFHFSTLVVSVGMFWTALTYEKDSFFLSKLISYIGKELSMWIYLLHGVFISMINVFVEENLLKDSLAFQWICPLLVCFLSTILALLLQRGKQYVIYGIKSV